MREQERYFILHGAEKEGPFDIVSMIRKVKNRSLPADALVAINDHPPVPASQVPSLRDIFAELSDRPAHEEEHEAEARQLKLSQVLKSGFDVYIAHPVSSIYTGVILAVNVLLLILLQPLSLVGTAIAATISFVLYAALMFYMLRIVRGQSGDIPFIIEKIKPRIKSLAIMGGLFAVAMSVGGIFALIPGLKIVGIAISMLTGMFVLTFGFFAPLLVITNDMDYLSAIKLSVNTLKQQGGDTIGVVFALSAINFIAGMLLIFPLLATIPITVAALCYIYDDLFSK